MAGDWIKVRSNIKDDPDVVLIAGILNLDEFAVVGRLHAVWSWLDQHSSTGTNVRITSAYLDRMTACNGFADAMREVGWLRGMDGDLEFPNFDRHNGESAKRRSMETKRKRGQRDKCPTNYGTNVPQITGPEKRREEKSNLLSEDSGRQQKFRRPTLQEVEEYSATLTPPFLQAAKFYAYYESNGWRVGRNPMKSWKAAITTWRQGEKSNHRETKANQEFSNLKHSIPILQP